MTNFMFYNKLTGQIIITVTYTNPIILINPHFFNYYKTEQLTNQYKIKVYVNPDQQFI